MLFYFILFLSTNACPACRKKIHERHAPYSDILAISYATQRVYTLGTERRRSKMGCMVLRGPDRGGRFSLSPLFPSSSLPPSLSSLLPLERATTRIWMPLLPQTQHTHLRQLLQHLLQLTFCGDSIRPSSCQLTTTLHIREFWPAYRSPPCQLTTTHPPRVLQSPTTPRIVYHLLAGKYILRSPFFFPLSSLLSSPRIRKGLPTD